MSFLPSKKNFIEQARSGRLCPLSIEVPFIEPVMAFHRLNCPYSFLFESAKGPEVIARYSFIGVHPFAIVTIKDGLLNIETSQGMNLRYTHPLKNLKKLLNRYHILPSPGLPPFPGGAACLINYDFVHYIEKISRNAPNDLKLPDAVFLFLDTILSFDHLTGKAWLQACPNAEEAVVIGSITDESWSLAYDKACLKMDHILTSLIQNISQYDNNHKVQNISIVHEMDKKYYMDIVKRAKEYIRAGDIFQANLSQRLYAYVNNVSPLEIYNLLRKINPSPFGAYMDLGDFFIVSSSPERLIRIRKGIVETRPIAGTRPRGKNAEDDSKMRNELLLNEKERAEHIMLIDLERNDLGRISDYGSVTVNELMITEDYSHVIHIVSNIKGAIAQGKDSLDVIKAVFPGGTITGVPKIRCMEIIDELEPAARGPYTGSMGYISFTGDMDLNIIIRTFVIKDNKAYVQAGAGIVADSDPEREYYETLSKAEALIKTLAML
jgi:anthranilate/para-aminobenzoate synthase component I